MLLRLSQARSYRRQMLAACLLALLPGVALVWLLNDPRHNATLAIPNQHTAIVTVVALLALGVAALVTRAALQIQQYRVLVLALGFLSMAGLFAVHAVSMPGMVMGTDHDAMSHMHMAAPSTPDATYAMPAGYGDDDYGYGGGGGYGGSAGYGGYGGYGRNNTLSVGGLSAFLSLFIPAVFFAVGYTRLAAPLQWRMPFRPLAAVLTVCSALALYAVLVLARTSWFANNPLVQQPGSTIVAGVSVCLFLFCAWHQYRSYLRTRLPLQLALVVAFFLLAEAQVAMVKAPLWSLAWWGYHVLMLAAVTIALATLLYEYRQGRPVRRILEGALELQIEVGIEIANVEELAMLAAATEAKDPETKGHTVRVAEVAVAIGREMGLPHATLRTLARAGLLHDIGKIRIPDAVLLKEGPLDDDEWVIMKTHPQLGLDILERVGKLRREAEILIAHHERINGTGYPHGLVGDAIPLEARIIAVADTFDAMVSDRPYRKGLPRTKALEILQSESGTHLYPPAVQAFLRILGHGILSQMVDGIYRREQAKRAA